MDKEDYIQEELRQLSDHKLYETLENDPTQNYNNQIYQSCRSLVFSGTVHWFVGRQAFIHCCGLHQV